MRRKVPVVDHIPVVLDDFVIEYTTPTFTLYHLYISISHDILLSVANLGPMHAMANDVTMATNYEVMLKFPRFNRLINTMCMHMSTEPEGIRNHMTLAEVNTLAAELRAMV